MQTGSLPQLQFPEGVLREGVIYAQIKQSGLTPASSRFVNPVN